MNIIKSDINGRDIYHAFISGAKKIISDRLYLNDINVFPVPDGDTGTNLAMTMNQIIISAECNDSADITVESIYRASLMGARGNSGMIFASFFSGLQKYVKGRNTLTMSEFSEALFSSVESAYSSVSVPVEGTMLTVLKDWAHSIKNNLPKVIHFGELIEKSLHDARASLHNTKLKLDVLKKANVVDSGGRGIVDFIEGIVEFFRTGKENEIEQNEAPENKKAETDNSVEERYCTEVYIKGNEMDIPKIRSEVGKMGSSVVVAGDSNEVKIHVHTNDPGAAVKFASQQGKIETQKIDDMKRQTEADKKLYSIALVTDSIADISKDIIDKYQIHVIPLSVFIDSVEYYDKLSITPDEFYDMADEASAFPTSSQPPVSKFDEVFGMLSQRYDSIIGFFVSSKLSGTFQNAQKAADKLRDGGYRIDVIDSKLNSGAQGIVLVKLAEMIHIGKAHEEIVGFARDVIKRARIYVSVVNFEYMVKGGRVSPLKGIFAKLMNVKPIVSLDETGAGIAFDKAFSVKAIEDKIMKIVEKAHRDKIITSYSIVYSRNRERAEKMAGRMKQVVGIDPLSVSEISCVVGISSGRGAVAVSFITER